MAHHILLVDDERVGRLVTQTILERLGFEVDVLDDGRGAADADASAQFKAIIMDCQMPHMDGFEATAEIRRRQAEDRAARTPIIGLSARAMRGDEEVAIAHGMDTYITKPVTIVKVRQALEKVSVDAGGRP